MARKIEFENLKVSRGACAMDAEQADSLASRIKLHLYRGSIEKARDALEAGWRAHLAENQVLPSGPSLLAEPVSRVVADIRACNMLEREGIETVGQFLRYTRGEFMRIPNMGPITAQRLMNIREEILSKASE